MTVDWSDADKVVKYNSDKHNVVLVFGGPGTAKGKLMSYLADVHNFEIVSMQQMVGFSFDFTRLTSLVLRFDPDASHV